MNIKDTIRAEIERRKNNAETIRERSAYIDLLDYIDTLPEQPASEGLEEAAERYAQFYEQDLSDENGNFVNGCGDLRAAFKAGAKWEASHAKTTTP